jgi:hypothetical protein
MTSLDDNSCDEDMDCDLTNDNDSDDEDFGLQNNNIEDDSINISPDLEKLILDESIFSKIVEHLGSVENELRDNLIKHNFGKEILNWYSKSCFICLNN